MLQAKDINNAYERFVTCFEHRRIIDIIILDIDFDLEGVKLFCRNVRRFEGDYNLHQHVILLTSEKYEVHSQEVKGLMDKDGEYRAFFFLKKPVLLMPLLNFLCQTIEIY